MLKEINIKSLRETIADTIRESIIYGSIKPGERLLETSIAKRLGVSRTPAREAFLQLDSEGFLEVMPRKGAIVKPLSSKDAEELYDVKSVLEGLAAKICAEKISNSMIDKLQNLNQTIEDYYKNKNNNPKKIIDINNQFHDLINKESKNDKLYQMIVLLRKQTLRYNQVYLSFLNYIKRSVEEHKNIIDVLKKRDGNRAEQIMRKHVESAGVALCAYIKKNENESKK